MPVSARLAALASAAVALAGCATRNGPPASTPAIGPSPTRPPASAREGPDESDPAARSRRAAKAAVEEAEELLGKLKREHEALSVRAAPVAERRLAARAAMKTAQELLEKLKEACEAAPEDGERIARTVFDAGWFFQSEVIPDADPEDRRAMCDLRDEMKRFHDRALGK